MSIMTPAEVLAELAVNGLNLPPAELRAKLMTIWPLQHGPLDRYKATTLIALFKGAGYVSDGPQRPEESLITYRGQLAGSTMGISWSTDLQTAKTYIQRYSPEGQTEVLRATAPIESVLARFSYEDEVVVEPDMLVNVESLGGYPRLTLPNFGPRGLT